MLTTLNAKQPKNKPIIANDRVDTLKSKDRTLQGVFFIPNRKFVF